MIFVGIDPGKKGAIAILPEGGIVINPMPVVAAPTKNGRKQGRDEYDLAMIRALLKSHFLEAGGRMLVTVEKSQPMPPKMPGGGIANFHRGVARGFEWMLIGMGIPFELVSPQRWQKAMHVGTQCGDTKQRSVVAAQRLFPGVSLKRTVRSRKDDDGCADALLLAEFGRRTYGGAT